MFVSLQLAMEKVVSTMQLVLRRTLDYAQGTSPSENNSVTVTAS